MKIECFDIKNYRSIQNVTIGNIGDFNVLIGKNNSGKSNLLASMDVFFSCLRSGDIIVGRPLLGRPLDFFDRDTGRVIELTGTFSLSVAERDDIISSIINEVPEMKNAVEGLDPSYLLSITIRVTTRPTIICVSDISFSFVPPNVHGAARRSQPRTILHVGSDAAQSLSQISREAQKVRRQLESIESARRRISRDY